MTAGEFGDDSITSIPFQVWDFGVSSNASVGVIMNVEGLVEIRLDWNDLCLGLWFRLRWPVMFGRIGEVSSIFSNGEVSFYILYWNIAIFMKLYF